MTNKLKPNSQNEAKVKVNRQVKPASDQPLMKRPRPLPLPHVLQKAEAAPESLTPPEAQTLQQTIGNRATSRLLQPKLTVGPVDDPYEREADAVAQQVVGQINSPAAQAQRQEAPEEEAVQMKPLASLQRQEAPEEEVQMKPLASLQRQEAPEEEAVQMKPLTSLQRQEAPEEEAVQMKSAFTVQRVGVSGGDVGADMEAEIQSARGGGTALPDTVRGPMEDAFGADFGGVKVHTDAQADNLNQSLQARAFTTGQDIFFRQGEYNPHSTSGQELLAHELTHTVQQNAVSLKDKDQVQPWPHGKVGLSGSPVIQRLSKEEFIDDTKQTILGCIPWGRAGDQDKLDKMDDILEKYENGKVDIHAVKQTAEDLYEFKGNAKLNTALKNIISQANELIKSTPELQIKEVEVPFLEKYPVAKTLVNGINLESDDQDTQIRKLLGNYRNNPINFIYSMAATTAEDLLSGKRTNGDCRTLATSFELIAQQYLGVKNVKSAGIEKDFFVPGGGEVLDKNNATGNVNNGAHWAFTSHYWVETSVGKFDLLFKSAQLNDSNWKYKLSEGKDTGEYRLFEGDYKVYGPRVCLKTHNQSKIEPI